MRTRPSDAKDLCNDLVKELLRLTNAFNMKVRGNSCCRTIMCDTSSSLTSCSLSSSLSLLYFQDFDSLRNAALHSLLVAYPVFSVPAATWSVERSDGLGVLGRAEVLMALCRAACALANVHDVEVTDWKAVIQDDSAPSSSTASIGISECSSSSAVAMKESKTRIKRPTVLAQARQRVIYYRNGFASVASLFTEPVMRCLMAWQSRSAVRDRVDDSSITLHSMRISDMSSNDIAPANAAAGDGVEAVLPAHAIIALAVFVRCLAHAPSQPLAVLALTRICDAYKEAAALSVRRACLVGFAAVVEAWAQSSSIRSTASGGSHHHHHHQSAASGALDTLMNLTGGGDNTAVMSAEVDTTVLRIGDWCMQTVSADADDKSRMLKLEILSSIHRALSTS